MGKFPSNEHELRERGYKFNGPGRCKGCNAEIEWWETPRQKKIPLNKITYQAHWETCPDRGDFRRTEPTDEEKRKADRNVDRDNWPEYTQPLPPRREPRKEPERKPEREQKVERDYDFYPDDDDIPF